MKNRIDFAITIFAPDLLDLYYFRDFIKDIYKLDMLYNPWYYDFYLNETYYIHLIDGNQKVFFVIPFKLSSNLSENSELVMNCYNILEKELEKFLDNNPEYNDEIAIYVYKDIVDSVNQDILIKEFDKFYKDINNFSQDVLSLEDSNIDILPDNVENIISNNEDDIFKRLDFSCTIFDLNKDPDLNLANDPDLKEDYIFNDVITFSNWIRHLYSNKILYDFQFNETYYIHLIASSNRKKISFSVVPIKLVGLEDEGSILNCFNLLKMSGENSLKEQIFVYIGKEILSEVHTEDIIKQYRTSLEQYKKIINSLKIDNFLGY